MAKLEPLAGDFYLWEYLPSIPAAVIFLILFLVMTALLSWRMFKTKTWFCVPFIIGGICKFTLSLLLDTIVNIKTQSSLLVIVLA
jgi:hypothetical protein